MYLFRLRCVMETSLLSVYKNYMIKAWPKWCFSLCIRNMLWLYYYNFRIGEEHRQKYFPEIHYRSCILQQTWLFTKPCRFYQRTFKGYDYDHLLFSYHGIPERHIRKTDISLNHIAKTSCCNTPSPAHEFCYRHQCYETKQVVKLLGIPEGKYSQTFQSRLAVISG
jgi:hypothetical protein